MNKIINIKYKNSEQSFIKLNHYFEIYQLNLNDEKSM